MQEILISKLHAYIVHNSPDVLVKLQSEGRVTSYLKEKVAAVDSMLNELLKKDTDPYFIEALCMHTMTAELRPSRYNYIAEIMEEEFQQHCHHYKNIGILQFELISMVESFQPIFDSMHFSEANTESRLLHYAICGAISEYLENKKLN